MSKNKAAIMSIILAVCLVGSLIWGFISYGQVGELRLSETELQNIISEQTQRIQELKIYIEQYVDDLNTIYNRYSGLEFNYESLQREVTCLEDEVTRWKTAYEQKPSINSNLREFRTEQELTDWLVIDGTDSNKYIPNQFDCEDFARMLQGNALNSGYIISIILVQQDGGIHCKNGCLIGNKFYFIEPQTDGFYFWNYTD